MLDWLLLYTVTKLLMILPDTFTDEFDSELISKTCLTQ